MVRNITTTISDEQYDLAIKNGWKWSQLIKAGIGAMVNPSVLQERIERLEAESAALKKVRDNTKRFMGFSRGGN